MNWKDVLFPLLAALFSSMTPVLRQTLQTLLEDLYKRCKDTSNPFDDMLVALLMALLGIPTPTETEH
ncbi:MAG TPA: hypothetical protein EYP19_08420 [Desulfobacterales bacterium]|nr:hypothetical protein [Desulfobacterales bacterium]